MLVGPNSSSTLKAPVMQANLEITNLSSKSHIFKLLFCTRVCSMADQFDPYITLHTRHITILRYFNFFLACG